MKGDVIKNTIDKISGHALRETSAAVLPRGSVLVVTRSGILSHTLPVAITAVETAINQDLKAILPQPSLDERFVAYALRAHASQILDSCRKEGTTVPSIDTARLEAFPLPLAPLNEQKRIADKLDVIFSHLAECRQRLVSVADVLRAFRRAVLRAAESGTLTENWRRDNDAPEWTTARADEVCEKVQSGGTPKDGFTATPGVPFLKVYNIVDQKIAFDERPQYVTRGVHNGELRRSKALPGDVLMNIVGPPLGKVAVVPDTFEEWNINQALVLFRAGRHVLSEWLYIVLCRGRNIEAIADETKGIAGQVNIALSQCRDFVVPIPSRMEQHEIVTRVTALLSYAASAEVQRAEALAKVDELANAALSAAFAGTLVPPADDEDVPVDVLLKRLASERIIALNSLRARKSAMATAVAVEDTMRTLAEVLSASQDWLAADEAFRLCGAGDGSPTDRFEELYAELRVLKKRGDLLVRRVGDIDELRLSSDRSMYAPR
jgi:type I restriction enzyme S subunit